MVYPSEPTAERSDVSAHVGDDVQAGQGVLWEVFLSRANLSRVLSRVLANRGALGVDGMTVGALRPWLADHWVEVRKSLEEGAYRPAPVRRVTIPRPGGGERLLGVPTEAAYCRVVQ